MHLNIKLPVIIVARQLSHHDPDIGLGGGFQQLLESDQTLVVLVQDRVGLPPEPLDQLDVSLRRKMRKKNRE